MAINLLFHFRGGCGNPFSLGILKESIARSFFREAIKEGRRLTYYFASEAPPGNRFALQILKESIGRLIWESIFLRFSQGIAEVGIKFLIRVRRGSGINSGGCLPFFNPN